jgi:feruloyl-CoA synthase
LKAVTPHRQVGLGPRAVAVTRGAGGAIYLRNPAPLLPYPRVITERLAHWAATTPNETYLAQRDAAGGWRRLTYRAAYDSVRRIAAALLARPVSRERPVVILSGNSIEHALVGLAAMHAGIPYAPISPAYALISRDFAKLRHVMGLLTPGLVFASELLQYADAIRATVGSDVEVVGVTGELPNRRVTPFASLATGTPGEAVDTAHRAVDPDAPAKILFTSGSTGNPKGVIQTQRMLCSNQQVYVQAYPLWANPRPVLVDWQPWHHTAGGNANFGVILFHGGTMYLDEGKPLPGAIETTVRNLREIAPTVYVSVPRGFEMLIPYLEREPALREKFFSRLQMLYYAGAGMSQHIWDTLERLGRESCGERVLVMTGLGATETGPFALGANWDAGASGIVGLPGAAVDVKLVPTGEKFEIRVKGPGITPGYWRQDDLTRAAFDDEGFYCMGDAVKFADPHDSGQGLLFDGRIAEDFKLATATWVNTGVLRSQVILACAPYVQDVVIAGHDRNYVAILVLINLDSCRTLCTDLAANASLADVALHRNVRTKIRELLASFKRRSTGSSNRVERAMILEVPASLDSGELTDKGSISQRAMLKNRARLVEALYAESPGERVIVIGHSEDA